MAQRPFQTSHDTDVKEITAKISNDNQTSKVNVGIGRKGYFSRIPSTVEFWKARKSVAASSKTWIASAPHKPIQANQ